MRIAHLLASPFFGGPERQVLGLANELRGRCESVFLTFAEGGLSRPFLDEVTAAGFEAVTLQQNWPHYFRVRREIEKALRDRRASILFTSGYKPDLLGLGAARRAGIPAVAIAHGWTGATGRVRLNEAADRWVMRKYDAVVSVSEAQARKVLAAGVSREAVVTIPNAVCLADAVAPDTGNRKIIENLFPKRPSLIVAAAGRLSPEKGFHLFVEAAARLASRFDDVGFVIFGEGPLREDLTRQVALADLHGRFMMPGFRSDIGRLLPNVDLLVMSSLTEGLPVILLEALAVGVPVVVTAVGGIPEVVSDGVEGFVVPAGDVPSLEDRISTLLQSDDLRQQMSVAGPQRIADAYDTRLQAERYQALAESLVG